LIVLSEWLDWVTTETDTRAVETGKPAKAG
jgi:hypothetical protein